MRSESLDYYYYHFFWRFLDAKLTKKKKALEYAENDNAKNISI